MLPTTKFCRYRLKTFLYRKCYLQFFNQAILTYILKIKITLYFLSSVLCNLGEGKKRLGYDKGTCPAARAEPFTAWHVQLISTDFLHRLQSNFLFHVSQFMLLFFSFPPTHAPTFEVACMGVCFCRSLLRVWRLIGLQIAEKVRSRPQVRHLS